VGILRIDGGFLKGRYIKFPDFKDVRPITSYIKKAVFDILGDIKGFYFADVFCGSGIFGIEAISRGAEKVIFVERSKTLCKSILENLVDLGIESRGEIFCTDAENFFQKNDRVFDVVFVDPPFRQKLSDHLMEKIAGSYKVLVIRRHKSTMAQDINLMNSFFGGASDKRIYSDSVIYFFFRS